MDAVEFLKLRRRYYKESGRNHNIPDGSSPYADDETIERYVARVEQWAKDHPVKTRQSEFLKMFPNARIDDSRVLIFCPKDFLPVGARSTYCEKHENCKECRKYREFIPYYNGDRLIWTATPLGCGDKDSDAGESTVVRTVSEDGLLYNYGACNGGTIVPACVLNPKFLNLRKNMAYVEDVSE